MPGLVEGRVHCDPVQPRRELGTAVERGNAARNCDERFLRGVARVLTVGQDAPAYRVHTVGVPFEERLETAAVTACGSRREFRVGASLCRMPTAAHPTITIPRP